jgi:chemotaxis protein methyltransferase CheR
MPKSQRSSDAHTAASRQRAIHDRTVLASTLFTKFQDLIYQEAGIWLATHKHALLTGRLARRLRFLGLSSMQEYYQLVTQPDQLHERAVMIDCITTNETHFFREPRHFDFLSQHVFPRWHHEAATGQRTTHLRVWSAGCSSGEEPYSLAMLLLRNFPADQGWDLEVLATDISTRILEKAREAVYPIEKMKDIPPEYLRGYMLKGRGEHKGVMKVSPELHRVVRFARVNLHADSYPLQGFFDVIFCRNVLIYFDQKSKEKVINGILRYLSPSGLLFVGHSEHLGGISPGLKTVAPTVHALMPAAGEPFRRDRAPGVVSGRAF